MRALLITLASIHFIVPHVHPPTVTLAWNASVPWAPPSTQQITGYNLYWGDSPSHYTNFALCGNVTNYTLTNLSSGVYFFSVTAVDTLFLESVYSHEAVWTNLPPPPVTNFLLSVTIQQSSNLTNWTLLTNCPPVLVTNSGSPAYWRALMNIQPQ
jgi:hypothetical protein